MKVRDLRMGAKGLQFSLTGKSLARKRPSANTGTRNRPISKGRLRRSRIPKRKRPFERHLCAICVMVTSQGERWKPSRLGYDISPAPRTTVGSGVKNSQHNPDAFLSGSVQYWTANYLRLANHQCGTQEFTGRLSAQELICHASEA